MEKRRNISNIKKNLSDFPNVLKLHKAKFNQRDKNQRHQTHEKHIKIFFKT